MKVLSILQKIRFKQLRDVHLSIRSRLIVSFAMVLLLLVTMSVIIFSKMNAISQNDKEINQLSLPILIEATNMNNDMLQINKYANLMVNSTMSVTINRMQSEIQDTIDRLETSRNELEPLIERLNNEEINQHYSDFTNQWEGYKEHIASTIENSISGKHLVAKDELYKGNAFFDRSNHSLLSIIDNAKVKISEGVNDSVRLNEEGISWIFVIAISSIIFTVILIYITIVVITKPISLISHQVNKVAIGDFTVEPLEAKTNDELGQLTSNFNSMTQSLSQVIKDVMQNVKSVTHTAEHLSYNAEETKAGVNQVAVSVEQVSSETKEQLEGISKTDLYMSEISNDIQEVKDNIQAVTSLSETANQNAHDGKEDMNKIIEKINEMEYKVKESVEKIKRLVQKTSEVDKIVDLIHGVSSQTNLLALNAAIEAARAGESGKGFAVVADEVRKLATQSSKATKDIRFIIEEIQYDTRETMESMEQTNEMTEQGKEIIINAGNNFGKIVDSTFSVSDEVKQVSLHIGRVMERTRNVLETIQQIEAVAKQNSANAETVAGISEEANAAMEEVSDALLKLSEMSDNLNGKVQKFIVD
ncbi:methyl-accepting chemotaxis protein [Aquibacillus albus]|uniref:Methyl-accepting chemotaxis protein n=1 Tax=Aquibacillus albus TaxID=1168171 RepID=A0ABS2N489_9BACI|nr:methyl-accepting chemotaxis protein [Aquibacillus albus]MBM7572962.1 methyl-accepting chemotaxis protein [Aquibacillus albus]